MHIIIISDPRRAARSGSTIPRTRQCYFHLHFTHIVLAPLIAPYLTPLCAHSLGHPFAKRSTQSGHALHVRGTHFTHLFNALALSASGL